MTRTKNVRALLVVLLSVALMIAFMPSAAFTSYAATASKVTKVTKVSPTKSSSYTMTAGKSKTFKVKLSPKNLKSSKKTTTVTSSKTSVATISSKKYTKKSGYYYVSFKVNAKKAGTTTVKAKAKYGKKYTTWKVTVKKAVAATGVTVAGTASVGQTLTATVAPTTAAATYQWYADGVAISGATSATYKLTVAELGKVITVKATAGGKTVESTATAKVTATQVTALAITGMTGSSGTTAAETNDTPLVGDTLTATTTPKDADVTYQWYRGTTAIVGATNATYTVTDADIDGTNATLLSVKIAAKDAGTTVNGAAASAKLSKGALKNIANFASIVLPTDYDSVTAGTQANPTVGTSFAVSVIDKTSVNKNAFATDAYKIAWYKDSVSKANLISSETATTFAQASLTSAYRGHKLIAVISGVAAKGYLGTVTSDATTAVKESLNSVAVTDESGSAVSADTYVGEKLTAQAYENSGKTVKADATYKWVVASSDNAAQAATSALSTSATYTITGNEGIGNNGAKLYCIATGTGDYTGTALNSTVTSTADAKGHVSVYITNDSSTVKVGDTLTATTNPSSYANDVDYIWTDADNATHTGNTIVASKAGTYTVTIGNKTAGSGVVGSTVTATIDVGYALPTPTIANEHNVTTVASGYNAYNFVGDKLKVSVKDGTSELVFGTAYAVKWYRNGVEITGQADQEYTLTSDDIGASIVAKVSKGSGSSYTGEASSTAFTGIVAGAFTSVTQSLATTPSPLSAPKVGSEITSTVVTTDGASQINTNMKYQWYRMPSTFDITKAPSATGTATTAEQLAYITAQGTVISGATNSTYTPVTLDKGSKLILVVTSSDYMGTGISAASGDVAE